MQRAHQVGSTHQAVVDASSPQGSHGALPPQGCRTLCNVKEHSHHVKFICNCAPRRTGVLTWHHYIAQH